MPSLTALRLAVAAPLMLIATLAYADTLTVFAAASLKNALDDIVAIYQSQSGDRVAVSYAASSALAQQIEHGAPVDVFVSADQEWMDYLQARGFVRTGTRSTLVRNNLVLVAPADSGVTLQVAPGFPLAATLGRERLAIADPDAVPAGRYAKAALQKLGVWNDVRTKIASAADVRGALLLVARGEAPLGIVYSTDASVEKRVRVVDSLPEAMHPRIEYPVAILKGSRSKSAERFVRALNEPSARKTFNKYGFR